MTPAHEFEPRVGDTWTSRDPRDQGLMVTVLEVTDAHVTIQRFRKTRVSRRRWHGQYRFHDRRAA